MEAYELCFDARDGMSGALDYKVLLDVMKLMYIEPDEQLDILYKVKKVERFLRDNRDNKGSIKKGKKGKRNNGR